MARAQKPDFRLSAKRTSPFKSAGASVQSTAVSRSLRISRSNAGYTMFRGSVKSTGHPLHSPVTPSLPLPCVTVCHHISTGLYQIAHRRMWLGPFQAVGQSTGSTLVTAWLNSSSQNVSERAAPTERCTVVVRDAWSITTLLQGTKHTTLQRGLHYRRENNSQLLFAEPGIFCALQSAKHAATAYEKWHCF